VISLNQPCTVVKIRCFKNFGVSMLTFWGHVTSSVTCHWSRNMRVPIYRWSFETITLSCIIAWLLSMCQTLIAKHIPVLKRIDPHAVTLVRPKLHYTDTGYGRAHNNSTTNLPHRNARAHVDMSRCWDMANFCPLVMNLLYNKL